MNLAWLWLQQIENCNDDDDDDGDCRYQPVSRATSSCSVRCRPRSQSVRARCESSKLACSTCRTDWCRRFVKWPPPEKYRPVCAQRLSRTRRSSSARRRSTSLTAVSSQHLCYASPWDQFYVHTHVFVSVDPVLVNRPFKAQWHQMVTFRSVQCHPGGLTYIFNFWHSTRE